MFMRLTRRQGIVLLGALIYFSGTIASGQTQDTEWEARPKVVSAIDLLPRTRLETWLESQQGLDFAFRRWRAGGLLSRRMRPILNLALRDIDEEDNHYLVLGGGYEYLHTIQGSKLTIDNTIIAFATPHIQFSGFVLGDRNRVEFRWLNGVYNYRYRNKLGLIRQLQAGALRFAPYGSAELFYNSSRRTWNDREYASGVQFPYKSLLMLDTYWLHERCPSCTPSSVSMIGVTLNLYLRRIE